jgi:hypothetical protein
MAAFACVNIPSPHGLVGTVEGTLKRVSYVCGTYTQQAAASQPPSMVRATRHASRSPPPPPLPLHFLACEPSHRPLGSAVLPQPHLGLACEPSQKPCVWCVCVQRSMWSGLALRCGGQALLHERTLALAVRPQPHIFLACEPSQLPAGSSVLPQPHLPARVTTDAARPGDCVRGVAGAARQRDRRAGSSRVRCVCCALRRRARKTERSAGCSRGVRKGAATPAPHAAQHAKRTRGAGGQRAAGQRQGAHAQDGRHADCAGGKRGRHRATGGQSARQLANVRRTADACQRRAAASAASAAPLAPQPGPAPRAVRQPSAGRAQRRRARRYKGSRLAAALCAHATVCAVAQRRDPD